MAGSARRVRRYRRGVCNHRPAHRGTRMMLELEARIRTALTTNATAK